MADNFWEQDAPAEGFATSPRARGDQQADEAFWDDDKPAALPADAKPSTAGAGRGSVNPSTIADQGQDLSKPSFRMPNVRGTAPPAAPPKPASVLEGVDIPAPTVTPEQEAENDRLSSRAYAERNPDPLDVHTARSPSMRQDTVQKPNAAADLGLRAGDTGFAGRAIAKAAAGGVEGAYGAVRAGAELASDLGVPGAGMVAEFARHSADAAADFDQGMGQPRPSLDFNPRGPMPYLQEQAEGAANSLAQSAAMAIAFGPGAVIPLQSIQSAGQQYQAARAAGLSPEAALANAVPYGTFEAIGEKFTGLDKAAGALRVLLTKGAPPEAIHSAGQVLLHAGVHEVPGEVITYLGQTGVDLLPGIGIKRDLTVDQFLDGLRDTVVQAGMMGVSMGGGGAIAAMRARQPAPEKSAEQIAREKGFLATEQQVKELNAAGEKEVAATIQRKVDAERADLELQSLADRPWAAHPDFQERYRALRVEGKKPAEAAARAGMASAYGQIGQSIGLNAAAFAKAVQAAAALPLEKVPAFFERVTARLVKTGQAQPVASGTIEGAVTGVRDDAIAAGVAQHGGSAEAVDNIARILGTHVPAATGEQDAGAGLGGRGQDDSAGGVATADGTAVGSDGRVAGAATGAAVEPAAEPGPGPVGGVVPAGAEATAPETAEAAPAAEAAAPAAEPADRGRSPFHENDLTPNEAGAHSGASSPLNDKTASTAQILAGVAPLGHMKVGGLDYSVENAVGSERKDLHNEPPKWTTPMVHGYHYGYFRRTEGNDGDHVDAFVREGTPEDYHGPVWVVDQTHADGSFDEHKLVIGPTTEKAARVAYLAHYQKGWKGLGAITRMEWPEFKTWVRDGKKADPVGDLAPAGGAVAPLRLGKTPNGAEAVTQAEDGTIKVGKYEAVDYDSGEPVKLRPGANSAQIKHALHNAGAVPTGHKFFGGEKAAPAVPDASKPGGGEQTAPAAEAAPAPSGPREVSDTSSQHRWDAMTPAQRLEFLTKTKAKEKARTRVSQQSWAELDASWQRSLERVMGENRELTKPAEKAPVSPVSAAEPTSSREHMVDYYGDAGAREVAHGVREGQPEAIRKMAITMAQRVKAGDVLVPMPGRSGKADSMLKVAKAISGITGARVLDVLSGRERESLYDAKVQGKDPASIDLGMQAEPSRGKERVVLIDGVLDTGTTAQAAMTALTKAGYEPRMLAYARVKAKKPATPQVTDPDTKYVLPSFASTPGQRTAAPAAPARDVNGNVTQHPKLEGSARYQYPESYPSSDPALLPAQKRVVDYMNGDIDRPTLMKALEDSGLPQGVLVSITQRIGEDGPSQGEINAMLERRKAATKGKPKASANTVFTEDAAAAARARLKAKLGRLNSGLDPETMMDGITLAGYHIEKGARTFAAYASAMLEDLGDAVRPYLKSWYMGVKYDPRAAHLASEMSPADEVEKFDVEAFAGRNDAPAVESPPASTDTADKDAHDPTASSSTPPVDRDLAEIQPRDEQAVVRGALEESAPNGPADARGLRGEGARPDGANDGGEDLGDGRGRSDVQHAAPGDLAGRGRAGTAGDYRAPVGSLTREGSWRATAERNVDLIELALKIQAENRQATPEEQAQLAKYVGFGASEIRNALFPIPSQYARQQDPDRLIWPNQIYDAKWKAIAERLDKLPREWQRSVLQSTQYAHYTSENVVRSIWAAVQRLGFPGGKVLEPGAGIGNFVMAMPEGMRRAKGYTGIEMDGPTALIARLLSPGQNMLHEDFIKRKLPRDFFDLAIGNPPFSQTKILGDPDYEKHGFMLHDFFFAKSIDRVRPGGLLVFVTSKGTMDKQSDRARKYLADRADLLGAVRLPSTAFEANAGTSVVTDVIFLRKREEGAQPAGEAWTDVATVETKDGPVVINRYYADHPDMVLGQNRISGGQDDMGRRINSNGRGGEQYTVVSYDSTPAELDEKFAKAVERLPQNAYSVLKASPQRIKEETRRVDYDPKVKREGVIYVDGKTLMRVEGGIGRELGGSLKLSEKDADWFRNYVALRDLVQVSRQVQNDDGDWEHALKLLNKAYDAFVKKHGPILDYRTLTRKTTDEDGNEVETTTRVYKNKRLLREDYDQALMTSLEVIDEAGAIKKAPFLLGRTIGKPVTREVKTVGDALAVSLDELGRLDLDDVASRLHITRDEAIEALGTNAYKTPAGEWQLSDEYLSGDVVAKLEEAQTAAAIDPSLERNIEALKAVQPEKLGPSQISVKLGASWVPAEYVSAFAKEIEAGGVTFDSKTESWQVAGGNLRTERRAGAEYGTAARSPSELLEAALNSRQITIKTTLRLDGKDKEVTDTEATTAAAEAIKKIKDKFKGWIWTDAERASTLVETYNRRFNNIAPRRFDGSHLTLPGVSLRFQLHPHQLRAIWRQIQTGNTYLAHAVGAGKTIEMIAGGMEQRRLGLIQKPVYVVPNHMLEQFSNEFMELYPLANIMVADDENFSAERRKAFVAAATLNGPDAIVITHSGFERIGVKEESVTPIRDEILDDLQNELDDVEKGDRVRRAQLEQQIEAVTQRFDSIIGMGKKDNTVTFEEIGADMVYADEAHAYRKLDFSTNQKIKGIDPQGSRRALDMYVKTRVLEKRRPGRAMVFASGTPVTNTMGELYTLMRFFAPEEMARTGITSFDSWARQFGEVGTALEANAAGRYENVTRFSKFDNVPELMSRVRQFMDVLTSEHLGALVKRPDLAGGKPNLVMVEPTAALKSFMKQVLGPRLEASRKWKPSFQQPFNPDPVLAIISDGRFAALDPRFFGGKIAAGEASKLDVMADRIAEKYKATADNVYVDDAGKPEAIKGSTQIVFYNLGFGAGSTANRGFDARAHLTKRLTAAGVKRDHILWFDDANTDAKKEAMFKAMRNGQARILIGSAKKMGTGVNVQKRLIQLHYFDPPWFPADVEQPHGRIIRQKNQNPEVGIDWYATKGAYDSTMWQMVARKQRFIDQAFTGDKTLRTMDDMSEASQYEQAAALASGDPRAIQLAGLRQDVERLERLQAAHANEQIAVRDGLRSARYAIDSDEKRIGELEKALKALGGSYFTFTGGTVGKVSFEKVGEFGQAIKDAFNVAAKKAAEDTSHSERAIEFGKFGPARVVGYPYFSSKKEFGGVELFTVVGDEKLHILTGTELGADADPVGLGRRLVNAVNSFSTDLDRRRAHLKEQENDERRLNKKLGAPFEHQQDLAEKYGELKRLEEELRAEGEADAKAAAAAAGPVTIREDGSTGDEAPQDGESGQMAVGADHVMPSGLTMQQARDRIREIRGASVAEVQSIVTRMTAGWKGGPQVHVIPSYRDLPIKNPAPEARGMHRNGQVWIVAAAHRSGSNLVEAVSSTLAHEAIAHYGLRKILGDDFDRLLTRPVRLAVASGNKAMIELRDYIRQVYRSPDGTYELTPHQEADEMAALAVEKAIDADGNFRPGYSWLKAVWAKVAQFLRGLGINVQFTQSELHGMLVLAARSLHVNAQHAAEPQYIRAHGNLQNLYDGRAQGESSGALFHETRSTRDGGPRSGISRPGGDGHQLARSEAGGSEDADRSQASGEGGHADGQDSGTARDAQEDRSGLTPPARAQRASGGAAVMQRLMYQGYQRAEVPRVQPARELGKLLAQHDAGQIDAATLDQEVRALADRMARVSETKQANKIIGERQRGADLVREKLLAGRRRGELDPQAVEFGLWFLDRNPHLAEELGISVREAPEGSRHAAGQYNNVGRIITLFKGSDNTGTAVHEILHHTERMMPRVIQDGIIARWSKQFSREMREGNPAVRGGLQAMLEAIAGSQTARAEVLKRFGDGTLDYDKHYQLVNPSEYWAVNATRILGERFEAGSWMGRARQWLRELAQKAKGLFGLSSDSEVLRGLQAVIDGDGTFDGGRAARMLAERVVGQRGSITFEAAATGQQGTGTAPVSPTRSMWRDETGRLQFAPGQALYNLLGKAADPLLTRLHLKAASMPLRRALREMKAEVASAQETAAGVAREAMRLTEDERAMVSDLIERELATGVVPPQHAVRLADVINRTMGEQTDELVRLGMLQQESADRWRGQYLPRYYESKLTRTAADAWSNAMRRLVGRPRVMKGINGKHLKGRGLYETVPVTDLQHYESMGWEVRDPDYDPATGSPDGTVQVWRDFTRQERDGMGEIRDAGFRFVMGYMQTQRDIALGRMFEALAADPTISSRNATDKLTVLVPNSTVEGTGAKTYGRLAGRYVAPETLSHLSAIEEAQSDLLQMYRKAMAIWKEGKTSLNPVSHVNNVLSNLTMAHFAGVSYWDGHKYMAAAHELATAAPMVKEARDVGLFLGTLTDAELMKMLPPELRALAAKQESTARKVGRTAFNAMTFFLRRPMGWAYQAEDSYFRYLIYRDARKRGMEPADAVDYAQRFIFAYDDMPKGARVIRDVGVPFFAYTYKAMPALLHTGLTHPLRFAAPAALLWAANAAAYAIAFGGDDDDWLTKLQRYLQDPAFRAKVREQEGLERENLPSWMKGTTALMTPKTIRLGMDEVTKLPLFIDTSRIIPGGDLFDVSPNAGGLPFPQPFTPSHPLFTTAVAMFGNKDLFFGKPIVDDNDTRAEATLKRADWLWKQLSPAIALGNYHWERGMNALAQATGHDVRWLPEAVAPNAEATGIGRDGLPVQPKFAAMQTFGIKVRPIDLDRSEQMEQSTRNKLIRDLDAEIRSLNRLYGLGAISEDAYMRQRELDEAKKGRLREGLTVDGDAKE